MNELIKTHQAVIGGETVNAVNARELHKQLKSKRQFGNWIKERIETYGFEEGKDFCLTNLLSKKSRGGHNQKDYIIGLDMAKELCMVENNAQGRKIRQYFIEIEKQYRSGVGVNIKEIVGQVTAALTEQYQQLFATIAAQRSRIQYLENFEPVLKPGDELKPGFRRAARCSRNGRPITLLIQSKIQPELFELHEGYLICQSDINHQGGRP